MNWLHYLLEANLYLVVFYTGYLLFLSRETHYTLNRAYLLFSCVVSFILPVIQLGMLKPVEAPVTAVNFAFSLQTAVVDTAQITPAEQPFNWDAVIIYGYLAGSTILLLLLCIKLYQLFKLTKAENIESDNNYKLVYLTDSNSAFSFFNFLFIGAKAGGTDTIIQHELVHIRQKHSADILFIEILKIINWFNPFIYLLQHSLRAVHEYIADEKTATSGSDTLAYSSFLVNNAYGLSGSSITHSFFNYNLLKRRIIMLHQKRSGNLARLKYLLAVPLCAGMLCASTLAFSKTYGWVDIAPHRINPANTSPQVTEPARRLIVKRNGISTITDKFSYKRADGTTRNYTAYNLSNKDKVDLKAKGIIVNILYDVKIDTLKGKQIANAEVTRVKFPLPHPFTTHTAKGYYYSEAVYNEKSGYTDIVVTLKDKEGKNHEFTKSKATPADIALLKDNYGYVFPEHVQVPPPPPPAPPAPRVTYTSRTSKNIRVEEYQYLYKNKIDFSVAIYKDNTIVTSYFKSEATPATIKFLSEKYGYTFPANGKYELAHYASNTIPLPQSAVRLVLPRTIPADPAAVSAPSPTAKMVRFPPPVVKTDKLKAAVPPPTVKQLPNVPQPAPPTVKQLPTAPAGQSALANYSAQPSVASTIALPTNTHYSLGAGTDVKNPFLAMFDYIIPQIKSNSHFDKNKDIGTVLTTFSVNDNHAITNVKVAKGINPVYDQASTIALSTYYGNLSNVKPGDYILTSQYYNKPYGIELGVKIDPLESVTLLPPSTK